jgi:hypothetical protein
MAYRIWIGGNRDGSIAISVASGAKTCDVSEQLYPSQMAHRVLARDGHGEVFLCTPTEAQRSGWTVLRAFPPAQGGR